MFWFLWKCKENSNTLLIIEKTYNLLLFLILGHLFIFMFLLALSNINCLALMREEQRQKIFQMKAKSCKTHDTNEAFRIVTVDKKKKILASQLQKMQAECSTAWTVADRSTFTLAQQIINSRRQPYYRTICFFVI